MNDSHDSEQMRLKLYEEVWSEPMTTVALRYELSDNGLRKRCKSMNIPMPPKGYWAKVKAGIPVPDRVPLPPSINDDNNKPDKTDSSKHKSRETYKIFCLADMNEITIEELRNMTDFELLLPGSYQVFSNWCSNITVPGRIQDYHDLILKHQSEIEYREARDKEDPFWNMGFRIRNPFAKVQYRSNVAAIPIRVSTRRHNRAYRIVDTILKAFTELKARISVERGEVDNISISLLSTDLSFEVIEEKTKRRYLDDQNSPQNLHPLYEEVYDGRLRIEWRAHKAGYYSSDATITQLSYVDNEKQLEDQITDMVISLSKLCLHNEMIYWIERKEREHQFEKERREQIEKEYAEKQRMLNEKRKAQRESLVNQLPNHANDWFQRDRLLKFADELESCLANTGLKESEELLQEYIKLVRANAERCNPVDRILSEMRALQLTDKY